MPIYSGTNGDDSYWGGPDADHIEGLGGRDYLLGNGGDDEILGGDGEDNLHGGDGNDVLDGGEGNDRMEGGAGGDRYLVDSASDIVIEAIGEGFDEVFVSVDYVLTAGSEVELLWTIAGTAAISLTGNELDNHLIGNDGANYLDGGDGGNIVEGHGGDDTLQGGNDIDALLGGTGNDILHGGQGNDALEGGDGDDMLDGGGGDDMASYAEASAAVNVDLRLAVQDTGGAGTDTFLSIESLWGSNFADQLIGTDQANRLSGWGGDDVIDAGAGDDRVYGQEGNDTINGGDGDDYFEGDAGNDSLTGSAGRDYLSGGSGNDFLDAGDEGDGLEGGDGDDVVRGGAGDDVIGGGDGDDWIEGGAGIDSVTGGAGHDTFVYRLSDLSPGDSIIDFGRDDRIVISDATLAGFTYSLSGQTLTFTGGSLILPEPPAGRIVARAASGGGVELTIPDARNDFNGDGRSDILWRDNTGALTTSLGQANGGFASNATNFWHTIPINWQVVGTADFNGDGRADILWREGSTGEITSWLGQANGGFSGNDTNFYTTVPTNWQVVGIGDFNGDGRDDLLWRNGSTGQTTDWLAQANGSFIGNDVNALGTIGTNWQVAGTGDFNGDGRSDILWRDNAGALTTSLGQANGGFASNATNFWTTIPTSWQVIGTGDFNGDGLADLLWRNGSTGETTNWLGQANGSFSGNDTNFYTTIPTSWQVEGIGDFNGDGRDDLLWRNGSTGQTTNWLAQANGSFIGNDANALSTIGTNWQVQPDSLI